MKSKKFVLVVGAILIILAISYAVFSYILHQRESRVNPPVAIVVSPETALVQTTNAQPLTPVTLSFILTPENSTTITSAYLKTIDTTTIPSEQVQLSKNADGTFSGTLVAPTEWLSKPQTVSFVLYFNGVKTSKIVRFAVTDISVTLPPDPGEAGKVTLAGIDSDHDGVRDDLQREIVFMYPGNDLIRRILRAEMKVTQEVLLTNGDHDYYVKLLLKEFALDNCYTYTEFGLNPSDGNGQFLHNLVKNTPERKKIYEEHNRLALPFAGPSIYLSSEDCTQPIVQGQY